MEKFIITVSLILVFLLFIVLIIGIVDPNKVIRWSKKPTRAKVFIYWIIANILIINFAVAIKKSEEKPSQNINVVETLTPEERMAKIKLESETKLRTQLETEVDVFNKGVDLSMYTGSVDALLLEVDLFKQWSRLIQNGENNENEDIKKLATQLKPKVVNLQIKEFPRLRKEYIELSKKKLWEENIEVSGSSNYRYIHYTGAIFASNKNKQTFQDEIQSTLKSFRFSRAYYKWFEYDEKGVYYTFFEGKDSDLL